MVNISENAEATYILISTIIAAFGGFILAVPLDSNWKTPLVACVTMTDAAILAYWKTRINIPKN